MYRLGHFRNCIQRGLVMGILALAAFSLVLTGCGSSQEKASTKIPHIGFLSASATPSFIETLQEGFTELGYIEGETIMIDWRVTTDKNELSDIAAEFVEQEVDVIIAGGTKAVKAAKSQTTTIPIWEYPDVSAIVRKANGVAQGGCSEPLQVSGVVESGPREHYAHVR